MKISKYVARSCKLAATSLLDLFFSSFFFHETFIVRPSTLTLSFIPPTDNTRTTRRENPVDENPLRRRVSIPIIVIYANAIIARSDWREVTMYPPSFPPLQTSFVRSTGRYYLTISAKWSRIMRNWSSLRIKLAATIIFVPVIFTKA